MKIGSVAEVKAQFSAFLKASEGGPVVVTRSGGRSPSLSACKTRTRSNDS